MESSSNFLLKKFFSSMSTTGETNLSSSISCRIDPESTESAALLTEQNEDKTAAIKEQLVNADIKKVIKIAKGEESDIESLPLVEDKWKKIKRLPSSVVKRDGLLGPIAKKVSRKRKLSNKTNSSLEKYPILLRSELKEKLSSLSNSSIQNNFDRYSASVDSDDAIGDLDNDFKENWLPKNSEKEFETRNDVLDISCWVKRGEGFKGTRPLRHKSKVGNPELHPLDRETMRSSHLRPISPEKLSLFSRFTFETPDRQWFLKDNENPNKKIQQNFWSSEGFHESMSLEYFSDPGANNKMNCEGKSFRFEENTFTQNRSRDNTSTYQAINSKSPKKDASQRANICGQSKTIQSKTQTNSSMFAGEFSLFGEYSDFHSISETMKLITANEPIYLKRENQHSERAKDERRPSFDFLEEPHSLVENCSKCDTQSENFQRLKESEEPRDSENPGNNSGAELSLASNSFAGISESPVHNAKMLKGHDETDVNLLVREALMITSANSLEKQQNIVPINFIENKETSNSIPECDCIASTSTPLSTGKMLTNVPEIKSETLFIAQRRRCRTSSYILNESCILYNENLLNQLLEERSQIMKAHKKYCQKKNLVRKSEEVLACTYIKRYRKGKTKIFAVKKRDKPVCKGQYKPPEHKFVEMLTRREFADNTSVSEISAEGETVSTPTSYVTDETRSDVLSTTENLSEYQKTLRDEIDKLCKNPKLLFSRFSDSAPEDVESTELLTSIHKLIFNVLDDFEEGRVPYFCVPKDIAANCTFKDGRYQMREHVLYHKKLAKYKAGSIITPQFNLILFILNKIRILLETRTKLTKREIFYLLKPVVTSQRITDRVIRTICRMLRVGPWALNLTTQKGLVYGDIKMILGNGKTIDCNIQGTSIPINICDICEIQSNAYFILVIEKESIFHKLLEEDLPNRLPRPFVLITGKGFPDNITQLFLKKLWMLISVPVFILVDADPDGIAVMLTYRFGSIASAHISQHLAIPKAKWLGVFPSDIQKFEGDAARLTQRDVKKIHDMLELQCVQENPGINEELKTLLRNDVKMGIEGLMKTQTYLSHQYLSVKFLSSNFI